MKPFHQLQQNIIDGIRELGDCRAIAPPYTMSREYLASIFTKTPDKRKRGHEAPQLVGRITCIGG